MLALIKESFHNHEKLRKFKMIFGVFLNRYLNKTAPNPPQALKIVSNTFAHS